MSIDEKVKHHGRREKAKKNDRYTCVFVLLALRCQSSASPKTETNIRFHNLFVCTKIARVDARSMQICSIIPTKIVLCHSIPSTGPWNANHRTLGRTLDCIRRICLRDWNWVSRTNPRKLQARKEKSSATKWQWRAHRQISGAHTSTRKTMSINDNKLGRWWRRKAIRSALAPPI